jgi:hypothetical protein
VESASTVLPDALRHVGADATLRGQDVTGSIVASSALVAVNEPAVILAWLNALVMAENDKSIFATSALAASPQPFALPKAQDGDEAEVVGIPLAGPGLHIVEIE